MKFRPDIEGLRALAIVPVVVFHAWPALLPGGFVGVDVFFVISGYLITTLLLQRLAAGSYSIASFYAARIRRIFPALFAMLALVAPACWLLLEPAALHEFARLLGATGLFASNIELYRTTGYFEGAAELKPLLHTWSLAVEEQYYIVFPPLLALLWRFARRRIGIVLVAVGLASLAWCLKLMPYDAEWAFFAAPARTFELMIGSVLAWWMGRDEASSPRPVWVDQAVGGGAFVALLASLLLMRADHAFPGPAALWPCLATAALIWVGSTRRALATRWLSMAPLRWIGAHSFSLYLWHWPVLVLTRHLVLDQPTPVQATLAVALSVALAWASLRWVEAPVRQSRLAQPVMLAAGASTIVLSLAAAWALTVASDHRASQPGRDAALRAGASDFSADRKRCHSSGNRWLGYDERCLFGPSDAKPILAVWGDSHGVEIARALGNLATDRRVAQLTGSSCPPALGYKPPGRPRCVAVNDALLARLTEDASVDAVLLVARHEFYLGSPDADAFEAGLAESIRRLRAAGKHVLLLDPVPTYHYPVPAALAMRWRRADELAAQGQTAADYRIRQAAALALVQRLTADGQAERVGLDQLLCGGARCQVLEGDASLYFDDNHLSMTGAAKVAPAVLRLLEVKTTATAVGPGPLR
ncbi:peptidoglycan/LPS O-acetylase OafA/YrhL/lysophospholipase L1-like esterase [Pelomonas saccharophila]|uniref:Peptidoglycan/LPS O-acetylase OafA/YrhL/lysophospholipase L1-like esterase n=1 Tax=Roseateles saccharophilus TaxID=304 RepID=A0ABU1YT49_ROSSA|nr:acyltransferase family protein [Roseateles saccharophilus]MDR7271151.1 peptidoglycan/LPS O-acetylase OafA/YrhL/lysophospholipase L1-like esterase [Roseateles saccharophilus]